MRIAYHGLGYVGLTGAVHFAHKGVNVLGYDPDASVVQALNEGKPKAGEFLEYLSGIGIPCTLKATLVYTDVIDRLVHIIAVPTERRGRPYDDIVVSCLKNLIRDIPDGGLIIVESTLKPGIIDQVIAELPWKERRRIYDHQVYLAVCPRRDWFADPEKNLENLDRIVGGYNQESTARAVEILSIVSRKIHSTTYRTAEVTKPLENALLHTQIAMAFDLARALPNHDIAEALRLAGTHWRLTPIHLNLGSGGRCVPLGTSYLVEASGGEFRMGLQAMSAEASMRETAAQIVDTWTNCHTAVERQKKKVGILGIAYRPGFRDMGLSPGLDVARQLKTMGYDVAIDDPMWTPKELEALGFGHWETRDRSIPGEVACADWADVVILATPHKEFLDEKLLSELKSNVILIDAQGALRSKAGWLALQEIHYIQVGGPGWTGA